MPTYIPVSKLRHGDKTWQCPRTYHFAAKDSLVPLALAELPRAATALPIALISQNGRFVPAALLGLQPGENLMVSPTGEWLGRYIPATYRAYPFRLLAGEDDQQVMCIDESSKLIGVMGDGEPFFDTSGEPSNGTRAMLDFLNQTRLSHQAAVRIGEALETHGLVCTWPLTVRDTAGDKRIEGLYQIDENALNALPADALLELRNSGALLVAYLQLLSMQQLTELAQHAALNRASSGTELNSFDIGETFGFSNLH
jgi:hypothetical protein